MMAHVSQLVDGEQMTVQIRSNEPQQDPMWVPLRLVYVDRSVGELPVTRSTSWWWTRMWNIASLTLVLEPLVFCFVEVAFELLLLTLWCAAVAAGGENAERQKNKGRYQ